MKRFALGILILAFVLLSASLVFAGGQWSPPVQWVLVNTAPSNFTSTVANCTPAGGDCQDTFTWDPVQNAEGYVLEITAHYQSGTASSDLAMTNCPDTVLEKTIEVRASSCKSAPCSETVDLTDNPGMTDYTVVSVYARVSAIIEPSWKSPSIPNGRQESGPPCRFAIPRSRAQRPADLPRRISKARVSILRATTAG